VYQTNIDKRSLRSALLLGAASVAAISLSVPASAQDQGAETVIVTGTRIPQTGLYTSSPVTAVGQQELKLEGTVDVETLLDSLPSVFVSQNSTSNNGSSGTSTIDLRGLGAERTLVLVNGTRLMPGDPILPAADVNTIPAAMVDHIEVLTGGASAVYGSDAIAGVVNFIMRKDFEGVEFDGQYGVDQHDNSNTYAQGLYNAAGFTNPVTGAPLTAPSGNIWDGQSEDATMLVGTNTANGKGNITAYVGYYHASPILEGSRDFSACTLADSGPGRVCGGSSNYQRFISLDNYSNGNPYEYFTKGHGVHGTGQFVPYTSAANQLFNYGALNYLQRNDQRYTGGFFGHYEVNKSLEFYSSFMFTDDKSTAQLAPSAYFLGGGPVSGFANEVNCTNPYLSQQENQALCGINPGDNLITTGPIEAALGHPYYDGAGNLIPGQSLLEIGRRNIEGGNRTYTTEHEAYRMNIGAKGDLGDGWAYDVYGQVGYTTFNEFDGGQISKTKAQDALEVDPITGQCLSGNAGCVGADIFSSIGGLTGPMEAYIEVPALTEGFTQEDIVSGNVTGDLGAWGGKSPWAKNPIAVSLGAEYRSESLAINPDEEGISGDLEGGSASLPERGGFNVTEGFTEVQVPLVQDMPWMEDVSLNGGYRYSSYNISGSTSTYKYGLEWQPIDDFRLRGSFERAVRAPNVLELFAQNVAGLFTGQDPCSGGANGGAGPDAKEIANCQSAPGNAKVPGVDVGSGLLSCPASQCSGLGGGNKGLRPEVSQTHTAGIVLTPTFFEGFTATVDYFNIKVNDAIGVIPPTTTLSECYGDNATAGSQAAFCPLVNRNPSSHQIYDGASGNVIETNQNTGSLQTKGWDFEVNYNKDLADWGVANAGSLSFNLIGTLLDNFIVEPVKGLGTYDCEGLYGETCGTPSPAWRHKLRVTWTSPWDFQLSADWRYFGEVQLDSNTSQPLLAGGFNAIENRISAYSWFDLAGDWTVRQGVDLRAGVNNIFDRDPPITAIQPLPEGNGNTFPGTYDSVGRQLFIAATIKY
jgi:outer membrane receptor protein involved in Fe transport